MDTVHCFEHAWTGFYISHFTYHLRYYIIIDHCWNLLTFYRVILNYVVYVQFKRANQSCSPSNISQLINVEWRNCDRDSKQFFQRNQEKLWSFCKTRNVLIEKNKDMDSEKYISTRFRCSLIDNTSDRRERHEWETSDMSATWVRHEQHESNTSETRAIGVQHKCDTSIFILSTTFLNASFPCQNAFENCTTKTELCNGKSYIKKLYTRL